ncbi:hypothetical protein TREMEDRAFT_62803 [Tremella mesenterica DSM 1558]|uniref:uncharacterized protein n=1 Tax=Tremella mesenterica (strain ATCC 24925 / CBS 8224 / DSM 1558 / NBRC 9311 / NRRL Y-6157 / RJB 2259-6 / UBC 559-6) TaxID=578456 RepID=UPI0003F49097|nr:uncharacterized protein TREMEDRAFT_62803 [Tremella mesenterica DSM 1558]EIW69075.1 hypothetical protein TREMEDRAFT_62803 [Tremella mesenterica DSM 1558]
MTTPSLADYSSSTTPTVKEHKKKTILDLLFIGTGPSGTLPEVTCLTGDSIQDRPSLGGIPATMQDMLDHISCPSCHDAIDTTVPEGWKNKRANTSILLRLEEPDDERTDLLIDCGKTFRSAAEKWFPPNNVTKFDLLITHGHMDAMLGLDDLRQFTDRYQFTLNVHCDKKTYEEIERIFPYLTDTSKAKGSGAVPSLNFRIFEEYVPFKVGGFTIQAVPVEHGRFRNETDNTTEPFMTSAFIINDKIIYMPDVSGVPERTMEVFRNTGRGPPVVYHNSEMERGFAESLKNRFSQFGSYLNSVLKSFCSNELVKSIGHEVPLQRQKTVTSSPKLPSTTQSLITIIDAINPFGSHPSHFTLPQALDLHQALESSMTYLVGMNHTRHEDWVNLCQSVLDPAETNDGTRIPEVVLDFRNSLDEKQTEQLKALRGMVNPAFDGEHIRISYDDDKTVGPVVEEISLDLSFNQHVGRW